MTRRADATPADLMARVMSEKDLSACVVQLARQLGWRAWHPWTGIHSGAGYPDLTLVRGPRLLFVELKAMGGHVTFMQRAWLDDLQAAGAETYIWRPDDWHAGRIDAILEGGRDAT